MANIKTLTIYSIDKDSEQLEPLYNAGGNIKWYTTLENSHKNILAIQLTPKYFPKRTESVSPQKYLYINVYSSFIHDSENYKHPKHLLVSGWMNELQYIHIMEYFSEIKRNHRYM